MRYIAVHYVSVGICRMLSDNNMYKCVIITNKITAKSSTQLV